MTTPTPARAGDPLSCRELQVITHMANGHSNSQIADHLFVATNTVKSHTSRIYRKLGARDRAHAVALAIATHQLAPHAVEITTPTRSHQ